jgi:hypothetical protein
LVSSNFWPLCSLYFIDLCLLITPLASSNFDHCVICPSLICVFCLTLWYLQILAIVFSVFHWFVSSDYSFRHKSMKDR